MPQRKAVAQAQEPASQEPEQSGSGAPSPVGDAAGQPGSETDQADQPEGVVSATVAPGRTLVVDGKNNGPGSVVQLARDEVARLRRSGHLVRPRRGH